LLVPSTNVNLIDNYPKDSTLSTKFTKSPRAKFDFPESHALSLTMAMNDFQSRMLHWLLAQLIDDGFQHLSANQLTFLGALDCGPNHGAELARRLGISRQAVHKKIKELEKAGWLETKDDEELGNQRVIIFTLEGERMMASARKSFSQLDEALLNDFSLKDINSFYRLLKFTPPNKN